ncbi:DNA-binding IclR family transcriptional regulator [Streptomyces achromogenes]|uniref:DNA-binding IclR family transcriptional regulator n=1 Tax=Streptomyces achromogenes TaxID=67255 RepID=A0ABU0Q6Q1_STRAH|nr:helix-turn-helix domain-containing protein [Streptomyces achromogenes]MDQ0686264.1 DNA-binding IclR family transcriptional regulator [Streptomyces achromogenes]MDQ0833422.1 DNA-binding IclR family transcriptional regulator [Streptomyces achromogenes]
MPPPIQSLSRAAAVLRLFATGTGRFGLSDTAAALDLPKSTVHGILHALEQEGLVEHDTSSGTYGLGPELVRLGGSWLRGHELRARALAWADDLARVTGEAVHVGVPHPSGVLIVHHIVRRDRARQVLETGRVVPARGTALGTALTTPSSQPAAGTSAASSGLLRAARQRGWVCLPDRVRDGMVSIAAPVHGRNRGTVAAVSVSAVAARIHEDATVRDRLVSSLRACARAISHDLGAAHP